MNKSKRPGIEISAKCYRCGRKPDCSVQLSYSITLRKCMKLHSGRWESMLFSIIDFSSLFVQAFQQNTAAALSGPRSGNPGYIVGKPLLALSGGIKHSVSFSDVGDLLQPNGKSYSY